MKCRYKGKIFLNEENGYTIAVYVTEDPSVPLAAREKYLVAKKIIAFTAIGYALPLTDQIELEMEGNWENSNYGLQFKVENFMEIIPRTREGILGYLSCGAIKGVGSKMEDAIYVKFSLNTLEVMENTPEELLKIRGISEKKLAGIKESFGKNKVFRDESIQIVRNCPYMLCADKGFGFLTVDAIGRQNFNALNDPMCISGCVGYVLQEAGKEGHLMHLMYEFLSHIKESARTLLLGDVNQLSYVGAGGVFRQRINCGLIPVTVLDLVYLQGADSNIPVNAQLKQENRTDLYIGEDFQFIPCKGA